MDYSKLFAISAAGMAAERTRVEVAALNLANANTVAGADGAFQPQRVVTRAVPLDSVATQEFTAYLSRALDGQGDAVPLVPEAVVEPSRVAPRSLYEPGHPLADANGFINVQTLTCAQLAGTWQGDADMLTTWYSGWYNGLAR